MICAPQPCRVLEYHDYDRLSRLIDMGSDSCGGHIFKGKTTLKKALLPCDTYILQLSVPENMAHLI